MALWHVLEICCSNTEQTRHTTTQPGHGDFDFCHRFGWLIVVYFLGSTAFKSMNFDAKKPIETTLKPRLLVVADDFGVSFTTPPYLSPAAIIPEHEHEMSDISTGICEERNCGILRAMKHGVVTCTAIMANGPAALSGLQLLRYMHEALKPQGSSSSPSVLCVMLGAKTCCIRWVCTSI